MTTNPNDPAVRALQSKPLGELKLRLALAQKISDEGRAEGSDDWLRAQGQADILQAAIELKEQGGTPPPVVIGMGPARMKARRLGMDS